MKLKYIKSLNKILTSSNINKKSFFSFIDNLKIYEKVIIYGAGNRGLWLLNLLDMFSINVHFFFDKNADKIGKINNVSVILPDFCYFNKKEKDKTIILISNHYKYHAEIKSYLYKLDFKNITPVQCVWYTGDCHFKNDLSQIIGRSNDLLDCLRIIEDEKSCKIYEDVIASYVYGKCIMSLKPEIGNQYFPEDVPFKKGYSKFIDCGSYTGDTISHIRKNVGRINTLIAFEPDFQNYNALKEMIMHNNESIAENILLYPCGLWNSFEQLRFQDNQGVGSMINESGSSFIQCVAMDDVLAHFEPTFIKMDIEGAEYEALLGSKRLISDHKPDLAICVYHSIIDICRIPLLINDWNLGYKFYLRCHEECNQEVVLYAICE